MAFFGDVTDDSGVDLLERVENFHFYNSACYRDQLVLRMLFSVNGESATISFPPKSSPRLYFSELRMSVGILEVVKACANILFKQGFDHRSCSVYLDDQCPLFSFQYQPGLVQRLHSECDDIAKNVSTALERTMKGIFKRSDSSVPIKVETTASLYLISSIEDGSPEIVLVTTDNAQQCDDRLDGSKQFHFSSSMFTEAVDRAEAEVPAAVTFNELWKTLCRTSDKWQELSVHFNIPGDCIRKIREHPGNRDNDKCLFSMLEHWCNNSHPTWPVVMSALDEIGRRDIAREVSAKYNIKFLPQVLETKDYKTRSESIRACDIAILDPEIPKLERLCKRLENERDEFRKDLVHEKRKVENLTDVQHDYAERIQHREKNIDMKTQELEECEKMVKSLSLQIEQNEHKICSLESSLNNTNSRLKATKSDLERALKESSVKSPEHNDQSEQMTGQESKIIQIDQPLAEQKFSMSQVHPRKPKKTESQCSITVFEVQRELSLADKEMNELESEVYKYLEAKRELQEEIDDIVDNLIKKKLMLCELEDKRLSISLQTQVDELTSSLSEAVTRTEETNMTLGHVQNEYKKSVENIKLKKVLMEKLDYEKHVSASCPQYVFRHSV